MVQFPTIINNITYGDFCGCLETLKAFDDFSDRLAETSENGIKLWEINSITNVYSRLVTFLQKSLHDETDTISFYIFECDYGENYNDNDCEYDYRGSGEIIETPLHNVGELWLCLALDNEILDKDEYQELLAAESRVNGC